VSSLLAPVIVALGQQNGLIVPLVAVHLFVFYFGIMADVTPPVGLASFAAAAVSKGDPIRTGVQAFFYSLRTAALPFLFIFNTDLLLIDVSWYHGIVVFIIATLAMLIFAAATQGWFVVRSRWYESILLLLVAFTLFRPGFWLDQIHDPYEEIAPEGFVQALGAAEPNSQLRLRVEGEDQFGNIKSLVMMLPVPKGESGEDRLQALGLELLVEDDRLIVEHVDFASPAEDLGLEFDQVITHAKVPVKRIRKEIMWIPGLLLLAFVFWLQRKRRSEI
jgi:hypothetical protein